MVASAPEKRTTERTGTPGSGGKPWLLRIAPFIAWQVIAVLFCELVLFWAGLGEEEIFKLDPELGSRHFTNKRVTWRTEGFAQSYLNEDGMREPGLTVAKPPGTIRVALLGDSMVEGLQVPVEQSFGQALSRRLSEPGGQQVQVLNFGTSGYSTAQEYLQLKRQVLKYQPDLVLLCYDSRDMFENWTPADEVITNVRPYALHLPGGKLVVDSYPVRKWMRSPRARFLNAIEWIRQHSRIWGLIAAAELQLSFHNPLYRTFVTYFTRPKQLLRELRSAFQEAIAKPSFQISFFEDKNEPAAAAKQAGATTLEVCGSTVHSSDADNKESRSIARLHSAAPNSALARGELVESSAHKPDGRKIYLELVQRTMGSLMREMRAESGKAGAGFAVAFLPVRAALCPTPGLETSFYNIDYPQEIQMITDECRKDGIPFVNCEAMAERLPRQEQEAMYYTVHLTPEGHQFIADSMYDFLKEQLASLGKSSSPSQATEP